MEEWAESITRVYEDCTDALMVNIARHFRFGDRFPVGQTDYQFRLLAEMGQLTSESIDIIAEYTGNKNELIREALEGAADVATKDLDAAFAAAIREGYFTTSGSLNKASPAVLSVLRSYQAQAEEKTNLVNTVMLDSTLNAYRRAVSNMALAEERIAAKAARLDKAQEILNSATGEVVLGVSSRQQAARQAVRQMVQEGLTGFIDRGGHHWSPEAYVNMDIRTTAGNVATESTFARNQDYGNDLIWVPILAAARPQCYPYQGKVYSTTNRSGFVEDLDGNRIPFEPLSSTTYQKEPAGLFGINCHHTPPNPFIPGFSMVRGEVPPKSVNDKRYAESQEQRELEREVRYARREAAIADAMGDKEAFNKAAVKVKEREAAYRYFVEKTGRTERLDRFATHGYNRALSKKVTAAAKGVSK